MNNYELVKKVIERIDERTKHINYAVFQNDRVTMKRYIDEGFDEGLCMFATKVCDYCEQKNLTDAQKLYIAKRLKILQKQYNRMARFFNGEKAIS